MSESRPDSGMASGAVLRPSARVVESQSRTRRVWERETRTRRDRENEGQRYGKYLS